jgi:hypothetical protein
MPVYGTARTLREVGDLVAIGRKADLKQPAFNGPDPQAYNRG